MNVLVMKDISKNAFLWLVMDPVYVVIYCSNRSEIWTGTLKRWGEQICTKSTATTDVRMLLETAKKHHSGNNKLLQNLLETREFLEENTSL